MVGVALAYAADLRRSASRCPPRCCAAGPAGWTATPWSATTSGWWSPPCPPGVLAWAGVLGGRPRLGDGFGGSAGRPGRRRAGAAAGVRRRWPGPCASASSPSCWRSGWPHRLDRSTTRPSSDRTALKDVRPTADHACCPPARRPPARPTTLRRPRRASCWAGSPGSPSSSPWRASSSSTPSRWARTTASVADQGTSAALEASATWDETQGRPGGLRRGGGVARPSRTPATRVAQGLHASTRTAPCTCTVSRDAKTLILFRWGRTAQVGRTSAAAAQRPQRRADA